MVSKYNTIGIIETKGLIPAIVFGDAVVDSADVKLIGYEFAEDSRIVSCKIYGTRGAVKAAMDIGSSEAEKAGEVLHMAIIGAPSEGMEEFLEGSGNVLVDDQEMINDLLRRAGFLDE